MVGRVGIEPTTLGLKGRCSTTEPPAHTTYYIQLRIDCKQILKTSIQTALMLLSWRFRCGSGGWIRTIDLRVMSPTSCHCSTPR